MTINDIYKTILKAPDYMPFRKGDDAERFCEVVRRMYEYDWLRTAPVIDKNKIHCVLKRTIQSLGSSFSSYSAPVRFYGFLRSHAAFESPAVWDEFFQRERGPLTGHTPGTDTREEVTYREFDKLQYDFVQLLLEKIEKERMGHLPEDIKQRVLRNVNSYLSSVVRYFMMYHCRFNPPFSYYPSLVKCSPLMELTLQGMGLLYRGWNRMEIRLPVCEQKHYPANITGGKEVSYLHVTVMKEAIFVPELVWRYPERIRVEDILAEANSEVRRVMTRNMGNETFLRESNAKIIDERDGLKLYAVRVNAGRRSHDTIEFNLVQCVCPSTLREYYLRVPPDITDANTAIAWTFGETKKSYTPRAAT